MKAAVYHGPNQPLKIEEWPTPTINAHEVLVKVAASATRTCFSDKRLEGASK